MKILKLSDQFEIWKYVKKILSYIYHNIMGPTNSGRLVQLKAMSFSLSGLGLYIVQGDSN